MLRSWGMEKKVLADRLVKIPQLVEAGARAFELIRLTELGGPIETEFLNQLQVSFYP